MANTDDLANQVSANNNGNGDVNIEDLVVLVDRSSTRLRTYVERELGEAPYRVIGTRFQDKMTMAYITGHGKVVELNKTHITCYTEN